MNADGCGWKTVGCKESAFIRVNLRLLCLGLLLAGCSSDKKPTTQPANAYDRQQAALRDPFGYSPNMDQPDVSGGSISDYDKKAMKRDVDHVLNP